MENFGISVLIPIYNFAVEKLVVDLLAQLNKENTPFEIRLYDDGSTENFKALNRAILHFEHVIYTELPQNLGRSAIRNLLAKDAQHENLLFLDCDNEIHSLHYIERYIENINDFEVLVGGNAYFPQAPSDPKYRLHWLAGSKREEKSAIIRNKNPYASFTLNNMLIKKAIYLAIKLDENIKTYGHEDTKFGYELQQLKVSVKHIDNTTYHIGLNTNEEYLKKTKSAVEVLSRLVNEEGIGKETKLFQIYHLIEKIGLKWLIFKILQLLEKQIIKNLLSQNPNLSFFDLFKLLVLIQYHSYKENV